MSRDAGVQIVGARELRRSLKAAGDDLDDLKAANAEAANIAARASASLAPRGPSGNLQTTVRGSGTKTAGIIRAGSKRVPYAAAVHWGRVWWPNKKKSRYKAPFIGQPFLSDGAKDSEGEWLPIYQVNLDNIIERIDGA